jgi:formate dehydrogenase major subunit
MELYSHPSEIMDEIAATTPTFAGVSFDKIDKLGSVQWPCNETFPGGHADHACRRFRARQGHVSSVTEYRPTTNAPVRASRCILTTGRILSQYNVGRADAAHRECRLA